MPPVTRRLPLWLGKGAGALCELVWNALALQSVPPMTRFLAAELATDHSYDLEPAKLDFGYHERVSMVEATERLVAHLQESDA